MRKLLTFCATALVVFAGVIAVWAMAVIKQARLATPETLHQAEASLPVSALRPGRLSERQLHVLLAVQDPTFFKHKGVAFGAGTMTTITQSLVNKLYFKASGPEYAKIRQTLIARFALNPAVSKKRQLTLFLNTAYLGTYRGTPVIGFAAAADAYFGKPFDQLNEDEFTALVSMLNGPNRFHPVRNPYLHARRVTRVKAYLAGKCRKRGLHDTELRACGRFP